MALWLGESIISIIFIVMGIVFYAATSGFSASVNPLDIGPAAFPRLMISIMMLASAGQVAMSYLKYRKNKEEAIKDKIEIDNKVMLLISAVLIAVYLMVMPKVGYFITTPFIVFLIMFVMGNRKWVQMLLVSAGFTLFAYLVFFKLLKVMLP